MTSSRTLFLAVLGVLSLSGCGGGQTASVVPAAAPQAQVAQAQAPAGPWVAEIRVKLSGCTSCADCRAGIRQISQSRSGSDHVEFNDGVDRIVYPTPAPIKALDVARALATSELLKTHVDRVELRVGGQAQRHGDALVFVASGTGQTWPLAPGKVEPPLNETIVIVAGVEGWKGEDAEERLKILSVETPPHG